LNFRESCPAARIRRYYSPPNERGDEVDAELRAIRELVTSADLPEEVQRTVLGGFDQLPGLYRELSRTYETRYSDRIVGVVGGMTRVLASDGAGSPEARTLAEGIVERLRAMHDRYGVAVVGLKPPPAAKSARKKKRA
jgi:hypothetical protein